MIFLLFVFSQWLYAVIMNYCVLWIIVAELWLPMQMTSSGHPTLRSSSSLSIIHALWSSQKKKQSR
jgi:hypothetical protein